MMGYSSNWRTIISEFEKDYFCLVFDQRGHGKSLKPLSGYHPKNYAADLYKIVSELNWKSFALIGHSMGGRNALEFASQHQNLLTHLIIEDITPEMTPGTQDFFQDLFSFIPTPFQSREASKKFFEFDFHAESSPYRGNKALSLFLLSNLETQENGSVDWRFSKQAIFETMNSMVSYSQWSILPKLTIPTLFIRGENSKDLPRSTLIRILDSNPLISSVEIEGAGHWVHFDRSKEFTKALSEFLISH